MAKVRTFYLDAVRGVPDLAIAEFITACEEEYYVNVTIQFVPVPSARLVVVVTKLDVKDEEERQSTLVVPHPEVVP